MVPLRIATDKVDKVEALNNFYHGVFTHQNLSFIPSFTLKITVPPLHNHLVWFNKKLLDVKSR